MPVQKLHGSQLEQFCANCGAANIIHLNTIELGVSAEGGAGAGADDLAGGASEVDVQGVGAEVDGGACALRQDLGRVPEDLHVQDLLAGGALERLLLAPGASNGEVAGGDHLRGGQAALLGQAGLAERRDGHGHGDYQRDWGE